MQNFFFNEMENSTEEKWDYKPDVSQETKTYKISSSRKVKLAEQS